MFAELLRQRLGALVELSSSQVCQLEGHYELLVRWNRVLSLTSVTKIDEIVERHFCESLFLGAHLPPGSLRIVDVGSGAGFPGIPVAVVRPDCSVALIESNQKKSVFLREATRELKNVRVLATRAEDVHECFDWALSRAVKFGEIENCLSILAPQVWLLAGKDRPSALCFTWNKPVMLPWGKQRYLWLGSRRST